MGLWINFFSYKLITPHSLDGISSSVNFSWVCFQLNIAGKTKPGLLWNHGVLLISIALFFKSLPDKVIQSSLYSFGRFLEIYNI